jgi:hypothetical protein
MKNPARKKRMSLQPFEAGQVWQMEGSHLRIGQVGKTLVHYKHLKNTVNRGPLLLCQKARLEEFLGANKAVLIQ